MDEHYFILEELIKKERFDVRLRYNTNLGYIKYKKWDNVELWENFKNNLLIFRHQSMVLVQLHKNILVKEQMQQL